MTPADYLRRYEAGESIETLALDAGCGRAEMREMLVHAGATIRPAVGRGRKGTRPTSEKKSLHDAAAPNARIARPSLARWLR